MPKIDRAGRLDWTRVKQAGCSPSSRKGLKGFFYGIPVDAAPDGRAGREVLAGVGPPHSPTPPAIAFPTAVTD